MWDVTTQAALGALDGLSMRGSMRANNIANAETPGFRAQRVEFESLLADALRRGDPSSARGEVVDTPSMVDHRGNSVDLATEMVSGMKDGLHRQAVIEGFNFKMGQMRVAMGGRR